MAIVGKVSQGFSPFAMRSDFITWRARFSYFTLLLLWGYAFFPTLQAMYMTYTQSVLNQHGLLVLPLFFLLLSSKRAVFMRIAPRVGKFGLVLLLLFSSLWVFSVIAEINLLQQLSVLALIPAIFILAFGYKISKALLFPLSYIFLLLPIGHLLVPSIQEGLLNGLVKAFVFLELPVYWEQHSIHTAYNELNIKTLSQGLNFSLAFLAGGLVYSYFVAVSFWRRFIVAVSFILFPVMLIFAGIYLLVCYELVMSRSAINAGTLIYYGWLLIIIGLLASIFFGYILRQSKPYYDSLTGVDWQSNWQHTNFRWLRPTIMAAVIFAMVPWVVINIKYTNDGKYEEIIYNAPTNISHWHGPMNFVKKDWQPNFPNATQTIFSEYKKGNNAVQLFSANYYAHIKSSGLMQAGNALYNKKIWKPININVQKLAVPFNKDFAVIETVLSNGSKRMLMWHWYNVANMTVVNKMMVSFLDAMRILFNMGDDVSVVAIATDLTGNLEHDRLLLRTFLVDANAALKDLLHPQ